MMSFRSRKHHCARTQGLSTRCVVDHTFPLLSHLSMFSHIYPPSLCFYVFCHPLDTFTQGLGTRTVYPPPFSSVYVSHFLCFIPFGLCFLVLYTNIIFALLRRILHKALDQTHISSSFLSSVGGGKVVIKCIVLDPA